MKVKRMGITEILKNILLFTANKMKISESFSKQLFIRLIATDDWLTGVLLDFLQSVYCHLLGPYPLQCSFPGKSKKIKQICQEYVFTNKQSFQRSPIFYYVSFNNYIHRQEEVKWQRVDVRVYPLKGGRCVFKWILRGHFKPTPNATIQIMFVGISIIFWYFWSTIDIYEAISLTQTFVGA